MKASVLQSLCLFGWLLCSVIAKPVAYWQEAQGTTWGDAQCKSLGIYAETPLEVCKASCGATAGCTAINHQASSSSCDLRKCERTPGTGFIVAPAEVKQGWKGYSLMLRTFPLIENVTKFIKNETNIAKSALLKYVAAANATIQKDVNTLEHKANATIKQAVKAVEAPYIALSTTTTSFTLAPLPAGWTSGIDPVTGYTYYWKKDDPLGTTSWNRPGHPKVVTDPDIVAKFGEVKHDQPEQALATRHEPWFPNWLPNMLWLAIPSMLGMGLLYRKNFRSCKQMDSRDPEFMDRGNGDDIIDLEDQVVALE